MKTITGLAICFLLFPQLIFGQSVIGKNDKKKKDISWGIELRLVSFDFLPNQVEVSNIPLQFRQVPVHPNDGYLRLGGKIVTIPIDTIKPGLFCLYSVAAAPQVSSHRLTLRGGLNMTIPVMPFATKDNGGSTREIHQYDTGTERGVGTSLVFYAITVSPKPKIGWLSEAEISLSKSVSLVAGYSTSGYDLRIQTGWDRYDALETYKTYKISSQELQKKYAGIRFRFRDSGGREESGSFLILGGVVSTNSRLSNQVQADSINLHLQKNSYFISIVFPLTLRKN